MGSPLVDAPVQRTQFTGQAVLDRLQANVRALVDTVRQLVAVVESRRVVAMMLAEDFSTTRAVAQNTLLTFPVVKGELWDVEFFGYGACSTVTGMKYAVGCPAGSVMSGELESSSTNTAVANWTTQGLTASTLSAATHVGASNAFRPDRINVRVKVGANGAITIQAASAAAADTTRVAARSLLRANRVVEA